MQDCRARFGLDGIEEDLKSLGVHRAHASEGR